MESFRFANVEIDVGSFEIRRDGELVHVEPQVFEVVRYLVEHHNRLVSKEELFDAIWKTRFVSESALTSRIKAARRALGDDGRSQRVIRTVRGRGYRFVAELEPARVSPAEVARGGKAGVGTPPTAGAPAILERDDALAALDRALGEAAAGRGRIALVAGEAGIGKTSVVRTFLARRPDVRALVGACDDLVTPLPLGPLRDLAAQAGPELADALAHPVAGAASRALLAELSRGPSPTVIVLEDLHWADEATIDALVFATRRLSDVAALLVLTYRDGEVDASRPVARLLGSVPADESVWIRLRPLSPAAVAELVGVERAEEVVATTGGVPFFVVELAAMGAETRPGRLPSSVAHAVLARIAKLPEPTRALLEIVSVEPSRAETALLDRLQPSWAEEIGPAERLGMVTVEGQAVMFRHELARRAVLDAVPAGRRRTLHREVARALAGLGIDPARVVHHAEAGADLELLVQQAREAARRSADASAHRAAWSHHQRILPLLHLLPESERGLELEEASYQAIAAGELEAALDLAQRSLEEARHAGDTLAAGRLHRWLSRVHWYAGRRAHAEAQAQLAVTLLESLPPSVELAWAYSNRAQLAMLRWRTDEAIAWGTRALELAHELGADAVRVHAMVNVSAARHMMDPSAVDEVWDAVREAEAVGEYHEAVRGTIVVAYRDMSDDRPGPAIEVTEQGLRIAEAYEVETLRLYLSAMRGRLSVMQGKWDEGEARLEEVMRTASSVSLIVALTALALVQVRRGGPDAEATLARVRPLAEATNEPQRTLPVLEIEAERAWLEGRLPDLIPRLEEGVALARPVVGTRGRLLRWLAAAGAGPEDVPDLPDPYRAELEGRWEDAAKEWRARGMPYEEALALARGGPADRARATEIAERLGAGPLLHRLREEAEA